MWLVYALGAVLLTSILGILFQIVAVKAKDARTFSFLFNFTILLMTLLLVLVIGVGKVDLSPWVTLLMVFSGIGYGLFQRYQFTVRQHIPTPEIQILLTPTGLAGYLLAVVWLNEAVTLPRVIGYMLVVLATLLVLKKPGLHFKFDKYVVMALGIGAVLSISGTLDRRVASHFSHALTYSLVLWLAQALVCFLPYVKIAQVRQELKLQGWRIPLLAVVNLAVLYLQISAIKLAPATQVGPVTSTNVVLVAVLSVVFLKDRKRLWTKFGAALLATVGLVLISR
jgi:drug/metabolite transporter (DMT)-like permease